MQLDKAEILIVGAGIIGLTIARELVNAGHGDIVIIEKEPELGRHASGRNSGVLHAGIYYAPDSLKAKSCLNGNFLMRAYCKETGAAAAGERQGDRDPHAGGAAGAGRALSPGHRQRRQGGDDRREAAGRDRAERADRGARPLLPLHGGGRPEGGAEEPHGGPGAKRPGADPSRLPADRAEGERHSGDQQGGDRLRPLRERGRCLLRQGGAPVRDRREVPPHPLQGGLPAAPQGCPLHGELNIYPVPDIRNPFLGVHFTRSVHGDVYLGPTAIPAFGRENYGVLAGIDAEGFGILLEDLVLFLANPQFRSVALTEPKKYIPAFFFRDAARLVKELAPGDVEPSSKVGIRPQLVDWETKQLVMDFMVVADGASLHVLNPISPAFTSSMDLAQGIVREHFSK